ncbi:MAG: chemotaxis protein CheW [Burkholderiales bacterium]|jgi:chemotaxis signal transduction protein
MTADAPRLAAEDSASSGAAPSHAPTPLSSTSLSSTALSPLARSHLEVRIADRHCLIELALAGELLNMPERVVQVPLARPWLIGVFSLRGQLMSLIDLARYQGWGQSIPGKSARVLALAPSLRFNAAILVDEVFGLHQPSEAAQEWITIDFQALVHEPAFLMASRLSPAGWTQAESTGQSHSELEPTGRMQQEPVVQVQP